MQTRIYKNGLVYGVLFLISTLNAENLFVAIDLSFLSKNFSDIRKYLLNGARSKHVMGVNHLIKDAIKSENIRRKSTYGAKVKLLDDAFYIKPQQSPHIALVFIGESTPERINIVHTALEESVNEYKRQLPNTRFHFLIKPGAYFLNSLLNKTYIVQNAIVKEKKDDLDRFISIIREKLKKYNVAYPIFQFDPHISFARLDSKDAEIIDLIKHDEKIISYLDALRSPEGSQNIALKQICLFDGFKRLYTYEI